MVFLNGVMIIFCFNQHVLAGEQEPRKDCFRRDIRLDPAKDSAMCTHYEKNTIILSTCEATWHLQVSLEVATVMIVKVCGV